MSVCLPAFRAVLRRTSSPTSTLARSLNPLPPCMLDRDTTACRPTNAPYVIYTDEQGQVYAYFYPHICTKGIYRNFFHSKFDVTAV